jgi:ribosome-binding protein aMBF1 (putative translation factor)
LTLFVLLRTILITSPAEAEHPLPILRRAKMQVTAGQTNAEIAMAIHGMRSEAGLSQRALAHLVGTTASVICRLEDASYDGHSLAMLKRIAAALDRRVEVRFLRTGSEPASADGKGWTQRT